MFGNKTVPCACAGDNAASMRGRGTHGQAQNYFNEFGSDSFLGDFF